jgi:hypothetical protein
MHLTPQAVEPSSNVDTAKISAALLVDGADEAGAQRALVLRQYSDRCAIMGSLFTDEPWPMSPAVR